MWDVLSSAYNSSGPAVLLAHNATNVASTLYSSNQNLSRDNPGQATKFVVPTVVNGKVYVGTANFLSVFGLLSTGSTSRGSGFEPRRPVIQRDGGGDDHGQHAGRIDLLHHEWQHADDGIYKIQRTDYRQRDANHQRDRQRVGFRTERGFVGNVQPANSSDYSGIFAGGWIL